MPIFGIVVCAPFDSYNHTKHATHELQNHTSSDQPFNKHNLGTLPKIFPNYIAWFGRLADNDIVGGFILFDVDFFLEARATSAPIQENPLHESITPAFQRLVSF